MQYFFTLLFSVKTIRFIVGTFCEQCAQDDSTYAGYYDYGSEDYEKDDYKKDDYLDYEVDQIHENNFNGVSISHDLALIRTRSKIFLDYKNVPICLTDEFMDTSVIFKQHWCTCNLTGPLVYNRVSASFLKNRQ